MNATDLINEQSTPMERRAFVARLICNSDYFDPSSRQLVAACRDLLSWVTGPDMTPDEGEVDVQSALPFSRGSIKTGITGENGNVAVIAEDDDGTEAWLELTPSEARWLARHLRAVADEAEQ